jgi:hypothetical protein
MELDNDFQNLRFIGLAKDARSLSLTSQQGDAVVSFVSPPYKIQREHCYCL